MELIPYVREILSEIKSGGTSAIKNYSEKFDNYSGSIKVDLNSVRPEEEIPTEDQELLEKVIKRVRDYHEKQKTGDELFFQEGSTYGRVFRPISRVGLYVPGGQPLPSSVIMTAVPARIAGVEEMVMTSPPEAGEIDPYVLYTAKILGVDEVYRLGGVQAIGAMAYGIGTSPVDKIFGPGNKYVNEAKRQVYGEVGIDGLAGPSEVCIIADGSAKEEYVLTDLKSQLEHGEDSRAWLLTTSKKLGSYCKNSRAKIEIKENLKECVNRANELAPEHLEIVTETPLNLLDGVRNAGAVYLGEFTPSAAADYFLGPNHVLPTGGAARFDSVLTVKDFMKPISFAHTGEEEFMSNKTLGERLAEIEGMTDHKKSLEVRDNETSD
ncbi:histidinol dehydrogenase [Candidatus Bipolaricaulota bacterium]|nr:histidinol dehydrogenase [Candidatus Bipolaricaulota bacterium]